MWSRHDKLPPFAGPDFRLIDVYGNIIKGAERQVAVASVDENVHVSHNGPLA